MAVKPLLYLHATCQTMGLDRLIHLALLSIGTDCFRTIHPEMAIDYLSMEGQQQREQYVCFLVGKKLTKEGIEDIELKYK